MSNVFITVPVHFLMSELPDSLSDLSDLFTWGNGSLSNVFTTVPVHFLMSELPDSLSDLSVLFNRQLPELPSFQ